MTTVVLPKGTIRALHEITGEARPEVALVLVLKDAVSYRLESIDEKLRMFEEKYGMTFEEFKERWEREDREEDYSWEAEQDYLEWEALVTRKRRLEETYGWLL